MMTARRLFVGLTLGVCVGGCADREEEPALPTEIVLQRATAFRQACAAKELEETAAENLALLESITVGGDDDEALTSTRNAAAGFARGYQRHAELRYAMYAMVDSAVNHATSPEDSLRYEERANAFTLRAPAAGTVEANAMEAYNTDLGEILADDDHPCNWNIPGMTEQP